MEHTILFRVISCQTVQVLYFHIEESGVFMRYLVWILARLWAIV